MQRTGTSPRYLQYLRHSRANVHNPGTGMTALLKVPNSILYQLISLLLLRHGHG
jgi:hypothetical protein